MVAARQSVPAEARPAEELLGRVFLACGQRVRVVCVPAEPCPAYVMVESVERGGGRWPMTTKLAAELAGREAEGEGRGPGRVVYVEWRAEG